MNTDFILTQFRQANSDDRMSLFMQYPEMRSFFEQIEKDESSADNGTPEIDSQKSE